MRTLLVLLALFSTNALAAGPSLEAKLINLIATQFDLKSSDVKVVQPSADQDYTAYIVNDVTECAVVEYEDGEKAVECDGLMILDSSDLKEALGAKGYDRL